ncbi:hypothetical protein L211DRAFT_534013 [Terfezia boudieri ATCC MYA-4762]|uniref:Uncharacterized protein n=1 Tax=Terfezia boudieri ATCC MYA-4762 TaxID=1051890 RepID=A0A3N4M1N3_9PEZI|nr:hypothetical protein L211DRAFT_534013 [Terfezia boudieri ATCC MYA-4762]
MHYQFTVFFTFALFGTVFCALDDTTIVRHVYQTVTRPGRTGDDQNFDIVGYRGKLEGNDPSNSATLDLDGLQTLAIEAHKIMVRNAEKVKKTNDKLDTSDPNKKGATLVPIMMTAMRPGPPGTAIYFHSSLKGPAMGESFLLDIAAAEAHPAIKDLIAACMKAAGSNHANEANCGEIMALNDFAMETMPTATKINLFGVTSKLLITVIRLKGQHRIMSPCTSSLDPTRGVEKKPDDPRFFGCSKVSIMAGFQVCEIGWTPNEAPTEAQLQELLKGNDVYLGTGTPLNSRPSTPTQQRRGLGNAVEKRAVQVPKAPVRKTPVRKTPVKPVVRKKTGTQKPVKRPTTPKKTATGGKAPTCQLKPVNFGGIGKGRGTARPGKTTIPKKTTGPTQKKTTQKKTTGARRWILSEFE